MRYVTRPGASRREREVFDIHSGRVHSTFRGERARERADETADELNAAVDQVPPDDTDPRILRRLLA